MAVRERERLRGNFRLLVNEWLAAPQCAGLRAVFRGSFPGKPITPPRRLPQQPASSPER